MEMLFAAAPVLVGLVRFPLPRPTAALLFAVIETLPKLTLGVFTPPMTTLLTEFDAEAPTAASEMLFDTPPVIVF